MIFNISTLLKLIEESVSLLLISGVHLEAKQS